jgi:hypothetical protein
MLSVSEMEVIQAGSGRWDAWCRGWAAGSIAYGAYCLWANATPGGWIFSGVILAGDFACMFGH